MLPVLAAAFIGLLRRRQRVLPGHPRLAGEPVRGRGAPAGLLGHLPAVVRDLRRAAGPVLRPGRGQHRAAVLLRPRGRGVGLPPRAAGADLGRAAAGHHDGALRRAGPPRRDAARRRPSPPGARGRGMAGYCVVAFLASRGSVLHEHPDAVSLSRYVLSDYARNGCRRCACGGTTSRAPASCGPTPGTRTRASSLGHRAGRRRQQREGRALGSGGEAGGPPAVQPAPRAAVPDGTPAEAHSRALRRRGSRHGRARLPGAGQGGHHGRRAEPRRGRPGTGIRCWRA